MYLTDTQVEQSCATLRKAIEAAENSNHAGEVFVVAAANATALVEALEAARETFEQINPLDRSVDEQTALDKIRTALTLAKGGRA